MQNKLIWLVLLILILPSVYSAGVTPEGTNNYYKSLFADWLNGTVDTTVSGRLQAGLNQSFYDFNITNNLIVVGNISGEIPNAFKLGNATANGFIQGKDFNLNNISNYTQYINQKDFNLGNISNTTIQVVFTLGNVSNNTVTPFNNSISLWNISTLSSGIFMIYPRFMNGSIVRIGDLGQNLSNDTFVVVGSSAHYGSLNATFINATQIFMGGSNLVQTETPAFKLINYSSEYASTGFKAINFSSLYGTEYGNTGWKLANTTSAGFVQGKDFNIGNVSNNTVTPFNNSISLWNISGTNIYPRLIDGNVGIGTTVPSRQLTLEAAGGAEFKMKDTTTGRSWFFQTGGSLFRLYDETAAAYRMTIDTAGNVGIGTTSPGSNKLKIVAADTGTANSAIQITDSAGTEMLRIRDDGVLFTGIALSSPYNQTTGTAANMVVLSDGSVQRSTSSLKYKTDLQPLNITHIKSVLSALAVGQAAGFTYRGIGTSDDQKTRFIGWGAETVASVEPLLVARDRNENPNNIMYDRVTVYLTAGWQDHEQKIQELKKENEQLKIRLAALESKVK